MVKIKNQEADTTMVLAFLVSLPLIYTNHAKTYYQF